MSKTLTKYVIPLAASLLLIFAGIFAHQIFANEDVYGEVEVRIFVPVAISFNGNGGTPAMQTRLTGADGRLAYLPTATRDGHEFGGWWSHRTYGIRIVESDVFSAAITLYARWIFLGDDNDNGGELWRPPTLTPTPTPTPHFCESDEPLPFADVSSEDWFYYPVRFVFCRRLMLGMGETPLIFAPNVRVTRGMVVQVLHNIHGRPDASGMVNPFTDVAADRWYASAVIWSGRFWTG